MAVGGGRPALRSACCRRQWHLQPTSARFRWDGENGPTLLIQTVEQLTGVRIDHYTAIDSDGLIQGASTWASTGMSLFPTARPPRDSRSSPGGWSRTGVAVSVARASGGGPHGGTAGGEENPWCRPVDAGRHSGTLAPRGR